MSSPKPYPPPPINPGILPPPNIGPTGPGIPPPEHPGIGPLIPR